MNKALDFIPPQGAVPDSVNPPSKPKFKHLHQLKHGMTHHPVYRNWQAMMSRCFNPNHPCFDKYSKLLPCEFIKSSPLNLLARIGDRPNPQMTVDRIDNTIGYHCGDCSECQSKGWTLNIRWATKKEQGRNRYNNRLVEIKGEWSEIMGVPIPTLRRWYVRDYYYQPTVKNEHRV